MDRQQASRPALPLVTATRYVTPLREGGSLPGLVEADDLGTYVVKFRGAGQGPKVLVAEVIVGELARALGLPVPDLVAVELDPVIASHEPDQEVQDLLAASTGLNLGMDFLPGALGYDPLAWRPDPALAARVLWLDALVGNVDRTWQNPNLLLWHQRLWLIDHGATLTFHHDWARADGWPSRRYDTGQHVLAGFGRGLAQADAALAPQVTESLLRQVVAMVPEQWLAGEQRFTEPGQVREAYVAHLLARVRAGRSWLPGQDGAA